jgi:enoyl-CoA hydratase
MGQDLPTDTSITAAGLKAPGVRFGRRGASVIVTLDRAEKLNALDSGIKAALASKLASIAHDPQIYAVFLRAEPGRVFSAGGDVRELYDLALSDSEAAVETACAREYALTWQFDCFPKPTICLIDGAAMGTAIGIMQAVTHRVAGEGYRFQMPETALGFFPDNGVCWYLARLPDEIGTWLGLTGSSIERADAFRLDLVTQCIDNIHFDHIIEQISDAQPIDAVLDGLHRNPGSAPIDAKREVIARCFSADTVPEILRRLAAERDQHKWCAETLSTLASRSPFALAITLQHLRRARYLDLRQTLMVDYRLAVQLIERGDFREAVRTLLVEKRGKPRWQPATLTDLGEAEVQRCFHPLPERELVLSTAQEMAAKD